MASSHECLVAEVRLLRVAVIKHVAVFKDSGTVIDGFLRLFQLEANERSIGVAYEEILLMLKSLRVMVLGRLVEPSLCGFITFCFQFLCQLSVSSSSLASVLEVLLHGLELRIVVGYDWCIFLLLLRVALEHIPFPVVGTGLAVKHGLRLLPVLPLSSSPHFPGLLLFVLSKPSS